jgi:hypothetical protein
MQSTKYRSSTHVYRQLKSMDTSDRHVAEPWWRRRQTRQLPVLFASPLQHAGDLKRVRVQSTFHETRDIHQRATHPLAEMLVKTTHNERCAKLGPRGHDGLRPPVCHFSSGYIIAGFFEIVSYFSFRTEMTLSLAYNMPLHRNLDHSPRSVLTTVCIKLNLICKEGMLVVS